MLKKILPIFGTLLFAFVILHISILSINKNARFSFAASLKPSTTPQPTVTITPQKIDYYLVYPGMLPDHPLYKLKMIRDRVSVWFAGNSLKKGNLYLLLADKRLGAGQALIEGNKVPLGISTVEKGEKYLELAVMQAITSKEAGDDIFSLIDKLKLAVLKHEEILNMIKEKVNGEGKVIIDNQLKLLKNLQVKLESN